MINPIPKFEISPIGSMSLNGRATNYRTDSFGNLFNSVSGKTVGKIDPIGRINTYGGEFLGFSSGLNTVRQPLYKPEVWSERDSIFKKKIINYEQPYNEVIDLVKKNYINSSPKLPVITPHLSRKFDYICPCPASQSIEINSEKNYEYISKGILNDTLISNLIKLNKDNCPKKSLFGINCNSCYDRFSCDYF